jgi:hypothetical protein
MIEFQQLPRGERDQPWDSSRGVWCNYGFDLTRFDRSAKVSANPRMAGWFERPGRRVAETRGECPTARTKT